MNRLLVRHVVVAVPDCGSTSGRRSSGVFGFGTLALENSPQRVVTKRAILRQRHRPIGTAPRGQLDRALVDLAVLAVADREDDRCARRKATGLQMACFGRRIALK